MKQVIDEEQRVGRGKSNIYHKTNPLPSTICVKRIYDLKAPTNYLDVKHTVIALTFMTQQCR